MHVCMYVYIYIYMAREDHAKPVTSDDDRILLAAAHADEALRHGEAAPHKYIVSYCVV